MLVCSNKDSPTQLIDHLPHPNQYGFRAGRWIFTPLFLPRRLTEIVERHSTSGYILFLDWSQAFDPIGHPHLADALRRYGIRPLLVNAIMAVYQTCQFFVTDPSGDSPPFLLAQGIRQGCPLSPYLFIIVLSAFTSDLHFLFSGYFLLYAMDLFQHSPSSWRWICRWYRSHGSYPWNSFQTTPPSSTSCGQNRAPT